MTASISGPVNPPIGGNNQVDRYRTAASNLGFVGSILSVSKAHHPVGQNLVNLSNTILGTIRNRPPNLRDLALYLGASKVPRHALIAGLLVDFINKKKGLEVGKKLPPEISAPILENVSDSPESNIVWIDELSVSEDSKARIRSALLAIDSGERRDQVSELTHRTVVEMGCLNGIEHLVNAIAAIELSPEQWEGFLEQARWVTKELSTGEEIGRVFSAVIALAPAQREAICAGAGPLINRTENIMNAEDRVLILNAVRELHPEQRDIICQSALVLTLCAMTAAGRVLILNAVSSLVPEQRADMLAICERTRSLIILALSRTVPRATAADWIEILNAVSRISPEERGDLHVLSSPDMTVARLVDLINDREAREAHNGLLRQAPRFADYLTIDFDEISRNPTATVSALLDEFFRQHQFPRIRYRNAAGGDEVGIDNGGITCDFITRLINSLCHPTTEENRKKLPMMAVDEYVLPKIEVGAHLSKAEQRALYQSQTKLYACLGIIFNLALRNYSSLRTGNHFHPSMFHVLYALTDAEINIFPAIPVMNTEVYNKLLKILLKQGSSASFCPKSTSRAAFETIVDEFVDLGTIPLHMKGVYGEGVTKKEILDGRKSREVLSAIFSIAMSITASLGKWDAIKGVSADELRAKIEGELTEELLRGALVYSFEDSIRMAFLTQWIHEATPTQRKNFLWAATGASTLPTPMSEDKKLHIQLYPASDRLPEFRTCGRQIDLPRYADYDTFKQKLEQSIDLVVNGNAIGFA